ncbi:PKD domain-containing protein [Streptomyces echinatus]|uniref:PKD domain-containing protein n=1 Tax=Streptomyces echinatus TaxID=67293 RepID=UPI003816BC31
MTRLVAWTLAALLAVTGLALAGSGNSAEKPRLLSGAAWLPSARAGQLALLDGSTAEVAAQVKVSSGGRGLEVVQQGAHAYAVDTEEGALRRVDGATFAVTPALASGTPGARPIPDAREGLRAFASPDHLYAVDVEHGVFTEADAHTLARRGALQPLAADADAQSTVLDDTGTLWALDARTGDVDIIGAGRHTTRRHASTPGPGRLVLAGGSPVLVDLTRRTASLLRPDSGEAASTVPLELREGDEVTVSGSPGSPRVYVISRGVLTICEFRSTSCGSSVQLGDSGQGFGQAVETGGRLFVPNYRTGKVWIVDLAGTRVVAQPRVITPTTRFQLLTRDGVVFFNDPVSERAGVVRLDGEVVKVAKYDPARPDKGVVRPDVPQDDKQNRNNKDDRDGEAKPEPSATPLPPDPLPGPSQDVVPPPPTGNPPPPPTTTAPTRLPPTDGDDGASDPPTPSDSPSPSSTPRAITIAATTTAPTAGEGVGLEVRATDGGTAPRAAAWDFGDTLTGSGLSVTHAWNESRTVQVSVTATFDDGRTATTSIPIAVSARTVTLTVSNTGAGTVTGQGIDCGVDCQETLPAGTTVTLTAAGGTAADFRGWLGCAQPNGVVCTVTVDQNTTISSSFADVVSSGQAVVEGSYTVDLDNGRVGAGSWDIWWYQASFTQGLEESAQMTPGRGSSTGSTIVNLGVTDFQSIGPEQLPGLAYSTEAIPGGPDVPNQLVDGDVFAVRTKTGNYSKVLVVGRGRWDITIRWITYKSG